MKIDLVPARISDKPILENLLHLYLHDFSEAFGDPPPPSGRFEYEYLPEYFTESRRKAFLIHSDGALGGFALVSCGSAIGGSADTWDLTEFFVARGLRRMGVGRRAASELFQRLPGRWEVRAIDVNKGAAEFWRVAISRHTEGAFEVEAYESKPDVCWKVFRFTQGSDF